MRRLLTNLQDHARSSSQSTALPPQDQDGGDPMSLVRALYKYDKAQEKGRGGEALVHASSLGRMPLCPRIHGLMNELRKAGATFSEVPMGSMRLVWAYGRAAETHVRTALLADKQMLAKAYGIWSCKCGHTKVRGHYQPKAKACPKCGTRPREYRELAMFDKPYALVGNPDFIFLDGPRYRVVEIKSIKPNQTTTPGFDGLEQAQPGHIEQACHYVRLGHRTGLKMHRTPLILYVSKGFHFKGWYKPFLPTDAQLTRAEDAVAEQRDVARVYKEELDAGRMPDMIPACKENAEAHKDRCPAWAECVARRNAA